jgi:hypothetical protein
MSPRLTTIRARGHLPRNCRSGKNLSTLRIRSVTPPRLSHCHRCPPPLWRRLIFLSTKPILVPSSLTRSRSPAFYPHYTGSNRRWQIITRCQFRSTGLVCYRAAASFALPCMPSRSRGTQLSFPTCRWSARCESCDVGLIVIFIAPWALEGKSKSMLVMLFSSCITRP